MKDYRAFILDLDGVIYRGEQLLPGARAFVEWVDATGRRLVFLSNNSFATPEEVAAKLARLGIPRPESRTLTAGEAAARAIATRFAGGRVYVLAVPSMEDLVERQGLRAVWRGEQVEPEPPDAILVGLDRTLTYERLRRGLRALLGGAAFVAVNRDPTLPVEDGIDPGTGAIVAALEYASGRQAEIVGKPAPGIVLEALNFLGTPREQTLLVGDALGLDIVAGHAAGVTSAVTLSGVTSREQAEEATGDRRPDLIVPDMAALLALSQEHEPGQPGEAQRQ